MGRAPHKLAKEGGGRSFSFLPMLSFDALKQPRNNKATSGKHTHIMETCPREHGVTSGAPPH